MIPAELVLLLAGMVVGAGGGVAAGLIVRRSPGGRPVRVTIERNAVPRRRGATLAVDPDAGSSLLPARGGPGDADRTAVPNPEPRWVAIPVVAEPDPISAALLADRGQPAPADRDETDAGGWRFAGDIIGAEERTLVAVGAGGPRPTASLRGQGGAPRSRARRGSRAGGSGAGPPLDAANLTSAGAPLDAGPPGEARAGMSDATDAGCSDLDAEADRRCEAAEAAREALHAATAELVAAREERDRRIEAEARAAIAADARGLRAEREAARAAFHEARERGASAQDLATAARIWLGEVDRINAVAAAAEGDLERVRAGLEIATVTVEHLIAEAESARLAADAAEIACVEARRAAAACAEAAQSVRSAEPSDDPDERPVDLAEPGMSADREPRSPTRTAVELADVPAGAGLEGTAIQRILDGEHAVLTDVVARLAHDDASRDQWEARLGALLEAILERAIDAAAVDVPADHPFWATFTAEQSRDIISALAALGHHFDGLGGWLDDRAPDPRDLSLAVAHAGLDPMRIRRWPSPAESAELMHDAVILGGRYLAAVAPTLAEDELRAILGRDAESWPDLWADWSRVREELLRRD